MDFRHERGIKEVLLENRDDASTILPGMGTLPLPVVRLLHLRKKPLVSKYSNTVFQELSATTREISTQGCPTVVLDMRLSSNTPGGGGEISSVLGLVLLR